MSMARSFRKVLPLYSVLAKLQQKYYAHLSTFQFKGDVKNSRAINTAGCLKYWFPHFFDSASVPLKFFEHAPPK